jgi:hypothetical protein
MYDNNINAMTDSIKTYYDKKLDKIVSKKTSLLIKNVKDLQQYNENMYKEFESMKNLIIGIQSEVSVNLPKLIGEISSTIQDPNDSTKFDIPFEFNYSDDGLNQILIGKSKIQINNNYPNILNSSLDINKFDIKLRYALTETENQYIINAFSPSSLVKFNELDGALMIDKVLPKATKINPWGFGPYIGFGLGLGYDIINNNNSIGIGFQFGIGITYNIFSGINNK